MSKRLAILFGIMAALFFFARFGERIGGRRYNPARPGDLSELRRILYSARPLQSAVEEYHQRHRGYPEKFEVLPMKEKHYLEEMTETVSSPRIQSVHPEGTGYQLYIKLNWDSGLYYHSATNEWEYDPGDGSATTVIEP